MTWKTRIFGDNVDRNTVESLLRYMGEDTGILRVSGEAWTTKSVHGKCRVAPTEQGLDIDLYVFRRDVHSPGGDHRLSTDNSLFPNTDSTEVARFHKVVPYQIR